MAVKNGESRGMESPMKWTEFEEEIKKMGYHLYWRRFTGLDDTLVINPSRDCAESIDIGNALAVNERCAGSNLGDSKREIAARGRQIIKDLVARQERLSKILPIAKLFVDPPETPSYARKNVEISLSFISIKTHGREVSISDDLKVNVQFDITEHSATIGELEKIIEQMKLIKKEHEEILRGLPSDGESREVYDVAL